MSGFELPDFTTPDLDDEELYPGEFDEPIEPSVDPRELRVPVGKGEAPVDAVSRAMLRPTIRAAGSIRALDQAGYLQINSLACALSDQVAAVEKGDVTRGSAALVAQAHTLDALFNDLTYRSIANMNEGYIDAAETFMKLALKAQGQCKATWEAVEAFR